MRVHTVTTTLPMVISPSPQHIANQSPIPNANQDANVHTSKIQQRAVILFGPTAVGKTDLLQHYSPYNIEVISGDSRQIYNEFPIATAHPPAAILSQIPHHLLACVPHTQDYTVSDFVEDSYALIRDIRSRGKHPLIVGGAAFYLYHLWKGLPQTPAIDASIRVQLQTQHARKGQEYMFTYLQEVDPSYANTIASKDSYRTLRALEVYTQTGRPLSKFDKFGKASKDCKFFVAGLTRPRAILYRRIDERIDAMCQQGLVNEIHEQWSRGVSLACNAARTIGVQEFLKDEQVLEAWQSGKEPIAEVLEAVLALIKRNSRRYAKRQLTFFSKFSEVQWYTINEEAPRAKDAAAMYAKIVEDSIRFLENA